jgi:hypothetical protein
MANEAESRNAAVDGYLATLARMEPDLHMVDRDAALPSIAISLKRIADVAEWMKGRIEKETG